MTLRPPSPDDRFGPMDGAFSEFSGPDLREYVHALWERRWYAVTGFIVVAILVGLWTVRQPRLYRATARIEIDMRSENVLNIQEVVALGEGGYLYDHYANTQLKVLRSRQLAERVVVALDLVSHPAFVRTGVTTAQLANTVLSLSGVARLQDSRVFDVTVSHGDQDVCALLANGIVEQYKRYNLDRRMNASLEAVDWLRRQAEDYKAQLKISEGKLQAFHKETQIVSLDEQQETVRSNLRSLNGSIAEARTARVGAQAKWKKIEKRDFASPSREDIALLVSMLGQTGADGELMRRQRDVASMRNRYRDQHPEMKRVVGALRSACEAARATVKAQYELARAAEDQLHAALEEQESAALALNALSARHAELRRAVDADRQIYDVIMGRIKEAAVSGKLESNNIRILDRAQVPGGHYKPNVRNAIFMGVVGGLGAGVAFAFAAHILDSRLRRRDEIESILKLPVLAMVPRVETLSDPNTDALVMFRDSRDPAAEEFRTLRANLGLSASGSNARVFMITSAGAGEGKTMTISNLAIAFAQSGAKTLLIDADLRRPRVHRAFGVSREQGLSRVLTGEQTRQEATVSTREPLLDLMPSGPNPPQPAELLGSERMHTLLEALADDYDRIFVDCTPVSGVSDPLVLLPHVDCVLFLVQYSSTHRHAARHAVEQLRSGATPLGGVIMNNVDPTLYRYQYYYHNQGYYTQGAAGLSAGASDLQAS